MFLKCGVHNGEFMDTLNKMYLIKLTLKYLAEQECKKSRFYQRQSHVRLRCNEMWVHQRCLLL